MRTEEIAPFSSTLGNALWGRRCFAMAIHFLFNVVDGDRSQVMLRSLASGTELVLFEDGGLVQYVQAGYLVYSSNDDVYVRSFDTKTRKVGSRVPLVENFLRVFSRSAPHFQVSPSGTLIYLPGNAPDGASAHHRRRTSSF